MWYSQAKTWLVSRLFASTNRCLGWSWSNINPGYFWLASLQTCIILFNLTINILLEFILAQYHFYKNTNYSLFFLKKWKSLSCVWLFVTPMDYTVHGILQVRILEWVAVPPEKFPGDLPNPGIKSRSPALQVDSLPAEPQEKPPKTGRRQRMAMCIRDIKEL